MVEKRVCAELFLTAALSSAHNSESPLDGGRRGREGGREGGRGGRVCEIKMEIDIIYIARNFCGQNLSQIREKHCDFVDGANNVKFTKVFNHESFQTDVHTCTYIYTHTHTHTHTPEHVDPEKVKDRQSRTLNSLLKTGGIGLTGFRTSFVPDSLQSNSY